MSQDKLNLVIIEGTTREQRKSIHATNFIAEIASEHPELDIVIVDPKDLNLPGDGNDPEGKDPKYTAVTEKADAFYIVTPEYNHSFPGSLKRLLDSELENYIHKPVAIAGVSSGRFGGARAVEHLVPVLREIGLVPTFTDVLFAGSYNLFDETGKIVEDKRELYTGMVNKALDELLWMAKTMKHGRDNIK